MTAQRVAGNDQTQARDGRRLRKRRKENLQSGLGDKYGITREAGAPDFWDPSALRP